MIFNLEEFKKEFASGDIYGLEYLEDTIIKDMKEKIKEDNKNLVEDFTREEYISSLYYATLELNNCEIIYETSGNGVGNSFDYDIYFNARDLLFKEVFKYLGLSNEDLESVYEWK